MRSLFLLVLLLFFAGPAWAQSGCVPNPNITPFANVPPGFVNGCPVPASGLNQLIGATTLDAQKNCGAKGDGITDDTTALQNCINSLPNVGGVISFPANTTYLISSTLNLGNGSSSALSTKSGMVLAGLNNPTAFAFSNIVFANSPIIKYTGSSTAISVNGILQGFGIQNLNIVCTNNSGTIGILDISGQYGDSKNLSISGCQFGIYSTTLPSKPAGITNADAFHNAWYNVAIALPNSGTGITLTAASAAAGADSDFDNFSNLTIVFNGSFGTGILFAMCDDNVINNVHMFGGTFAGINPVLYDYTSAPIWPAGNTVNQADFGVIHGTGFFNNGTPSVAAAPNWLSHLSLTNGQSYPVNLPNLIVDHATGTFTPTLLGSGTAGTPVYSTQFGSYVVNGYEVTVNFSVTTSSLGGATGNLLLGGLPVTSSPTTNDVGSCVIHEVTGWTADAGFTWITGVVVTNSTQIGFLENGSAKTVQQTPLSDFAAATQLIGQCHYRRIGGTN